MTEQYHLHLSLSLIGEGNGNPLQCSCLENPRDGGAWWAAVYGVAQSRTRLKQLSSSSSLKLSQFFSLRRYCFEKDPWYSPYLLQIILNTSFSQSLTWLYILAWHTKRQTQFSGSSIPSVSEVFHNPYLLKLKGNSRDYDLLEDS